MSASSDALLVLMLHWNSQTKHAKTFKIVNQITGRSICVQWISNIETQNINELVYIIETSSHSKRWTGPAHFDIIKFAAWIPLKKELK